MMNHFLVNTNKVREFAIQVNGIPFDATVFVIEADKAFIPFTSKGGVIIFDLRVPTAWEEHNLPVILITGGQWYPMNEELGISTR